MPKKINFLGGMQNYDAETGKYEPALKGPNGESPSSFKQFKKGKDSEKEEVKTEQAVKAKEKKEDFNSVNGKRIGKEKEVEVTDDEISEALADYAMWEVNKDTTAGQYAESIANKLGCSKEQVFNVIKQQAPNEIKESSNMQKIIDAYENEEEFFDESNKQKIIQDDYESIMQDPSIYLEDDKIEEIKKFGAESGAGYSTVLSSVATYMANGKDYKEAIEKAKADINKSNEVFGKPPVVEKNLDDYTDELFKKTNLTTFNSKKYKNQNGEIVEIRRFGEGKNAIRYNETTKQVEQVWIDGERVK